MKHFDNHKRRYLITVPSAIVAVAWLCGVVLFPSFKNMPLGYLPVAGGMVLAAVLALKDASIASRLDGKADWFVWKHALLIAIFLGIALRLVWLIWPAEFISDHSYYFAGGRAILEGQGIGANPEYPPGPFYFVALALSLFGDHLNSVVFMNALIFIGTLLLTYFYLNEEKKLCRRIAVILLALYPSLVIYSGSPGYENQLMFLVMLMVVLTKLIKERSDGPPLIRHALGACLGIVFGLAALTHPPYIVGPLLFGAALYLSGSRLLPALTLGLVSLLFCLAVIAPWTLRNLSVYDKFFLISANGGVVLLSANNPLSDGIFSPTDALYPYRPGEDRIDYNERMAKKAIHYIREDPQRFLKLCLKRIAYMWGTDTSGIGLVMKRGSAKDMASFLAQLFWVPTLIFAGLFIFLRLKSGDVSAGTGFALLLILYKFALHAVFEPLSRHHLEIIPLLIIFACTGFCQIADMKTGKSAQAV